MGGWVGLLGGGEGIRVVEVVVAVVAAVAIAGVVALMVVVAHPLFGTVVPAATAIKRSSLADTNKNATAAGCCCLAANNCEAGKSKHARRPAIQVAVPNT